MKNEWLTSKTLNALDFKYATSWLKVQGRQDIPRSPAATWSTVSHGNYASPQHHLCFFGCIGVYVLQFFHAKISQRTGKKLLFIATPFAAHGQNQHLTFHEMVNLSIQTLYRTNSERKLRKVLCCFPPNVAADGEDLTTTFSCFQIGGIVLLVKSVKPVKCYLPFSSTSNPMLTAWFRRASILAALSWWCTQNCRGMLYVTGVYCLVLVQSRQYLQFAYLGGKQLFANVFLRRCNNDKENSFQRWGHHKFLSIECTYIPAVKSSQHLSQLRDVIVTLPELGLGHLWIILIDENLLTTSYVQLSDQLFVWIWRLWAFFDWFLAR